MARRKPRHAAVVARHDVVHGLQEIPAMTHCLFWIAAALSMCSSWAVASPAPVALTEKVLVLRDSFKPGQQPDGNSVIFVGTSALVVLDSGRHLEHTQALLDFASERGTPIVTLINSHWHLDHLGGNALLRDKVPALKVIASDGVGPALKGWLANSRREMQAMLDGGKLDAATQAMVNWDIALIDQGSKLLPDVALIAPSSEDSAGRKLLIGRETKAVTAADLWVWDAESKALAAGDLVTLPVPFFDTACAAGWQRALGHLEALPFDQLVPGHGAPMNRAEFAVWRKGFDGLLACAASEATTATCSDGWVATLGPLLSQSDQLQARRMLGYYIDNLLRAEAAQRDRFC